MKIISLNAWGGKIFEPLMEFISFKAGGTDVFCFQEMLFGQEKDFTPIVGGRINLFDEIQARLPEFVGYKYLAKASSYFGGEKLPDGCEIGQAIFVRNSIKVVDFGGLRAYAEGGKIDQDPALTVCGNLQYVKLKIASQFLTVANLHGLWQQGSQKMDTPERLTQSKIVKEFIKKQIGSKILVGDFNLRPETKSIEMLDEILKDLIKEYNITSTRSKFYQKEIKYADFAFVSLDVNVQDFQVLSDPVSDHLPLYLEFDLD
ncbi:MAG: hypothetical protein JW816_01645 [Candidatus Buchananbacteria bacterium]|nr:hypothetical protein [Candidatus Buchananbacteria bacterium]